MTVNRVLLDELNQIDVKEILDLEFLQEFQDVFAQTVGVASIAVDIQGQPITQPSQFTRFCMDLTRSTPEGRKRCMKCDSQGGQMAAQTGKPSIYECHAGLVDFAAPIILEGKQIGSILGGQVLTEKANEEKFRRIAQEIGIKEEDYIEALKDIESISRKRVEKAAELLYVVARNISEMGYQKVKIKNVAEVLNANLQQISASIQETAVLTERVAGNQNDLNDQIQKVNHLSSQITQFIDSIKKIASRTKMLGLNASIEAARAREWGLGFGIVAQEIQKLSDDSKQMTEKISDFTINIQETINKTTGMGDNTLTAAQQQTAAVEEIVASVQELATVANHLLDLAK